MMQSAGLHLEEEDVEMQNHGNPVPPPSSSSSSSASTLIPPSLPLPPPSTSTSFHPSFLFCGDCTSCGDTPEMPNPAMSMLTTFPKKKKKKKKHKKAAMVFVSDFNEYENIESRDSTDSNFDLDIEADAAAGATNNNNNNNNNNADHENGSDIIKSTVSFDQLNSSQLTMVRKVLEGMQYVHSFQIVSNDEFTTNDTNGTSTSMSTTCAIHDNDDEEARASIITNQLVDIHYNPNLVSIDKILSSFQDLGLSNSIQQHPTNNNEPTSTSKSNSANPANTNTKMKCRSSFYVDGICCASEIPIVTNIIKRLPKKRKYIYGIRINVTIRMTYVEYHPEYVTANDILDELISQGFQKSSIEEDGNILFQKRKKKKEEEIRKKNQKMNLNIDSNDNKNSNSNSNSSDSNNSNRVSFTEEMKNIPISDESSSPTSTITGTDTATNETSSSRFVESVLYKESLNEDDIEIIHEVFMTNNFLYDYIRSYSPNIVSKTIKIEHNPNLLSIHNILDVLTSEDTENDYYGKFDECTILVDGFHEGLFVPSSTKARMNQDGYHHHHVESNDSTGAGTHTEQEGSQDLRSTFAAGKSSSTSFKRMQQKSFRWFRSIGIGTEHGLSVSIILSGIFWVLSVIGHFTNNQILMYLGLLAVMFGLPPVAKKAFRTLRRKQFDANCMMATAAIGAVALQQFDEAASVSFLFAISEFLEDRATRKAKKAMDEIISLRPDHANYIDGDTGEIKIVPVNDLDIGDLVSVRMGDKIPSDGVVVEGLSQIDEASLTGESMPINKGVGDAVSGGTINVGRTRLVIRMSSLVEDSAVSRLIRLVEESASSRSPTEQLVDSFARSYTPAVIFAALIMCTVPWIFGAEVGREWMLNGLIIVVIACPCALTISTPVTYAAGLAATAQRGIIVKGGAKLEALGKVKKIVFDKTGTLTEGKFRLVDLKLVGTKRTRREVLELLAIMEGPSSHPLAATLVNAAKDEGVHISSQTKVLDHSILKGEGVTALVNGQETYVGNVRLFKRLGMYSKLLDEERKRVVQWNNKGSTVGLIGIKEVGIIGMFCVADTVRDEAKEVISTFASDGIEVFMLTGDGEGPAKAVAAAVGIPQECVKSQFLPEDKLHHVASMLKSSKQGTMFEKQELLLMCGDGVNDAPALAVADVGVAMGEGAALALEISDVTLMDSNLSKLLFSIKTGMKVIATVQENIAFSVAAKIIVIALTFMGKMTLLGAIASDVGVMLLVSINGMKLLPGGSGLCCKKRNKYGKVPILQEPMNNIV